MLCCTLYCIELFFGLSHAGSGASPSSTGHQSSIGTAEGQPPQQPANSSPSNTHWHSFSPGDLPEASRPVSACASHELLCMRSFCDQSLQLDSRCFQHLSVAVARFLTALANHVETCQTVDRKHRAQCSLQLAACPAANVQSMSVRDTPLMQH